MELYDFPLALLLLTLSVGYIILPKIYTAFFGPLVQIPGPVYSKWTDLPLKSAVLSGRRIHFIHDLHQRYGPIIRVAPTEVAVSDPAAVKQIHRINSGFHKTKWYYAFNAVDAPNVFTMIDPKQVGERRRLLAQPMSETALKTYEDEIWAKTRKAVTAISNDIKSHGYSDVFQWWFFWATDIIGDMSFGQGFDMLDSGEKNRYVRDLEKNGFTSNMNAELPLFLKIASYLPSSRIQDFIGSASRLEKDSYALVQRYRSELSHRPTLFSKFFKAGESGGLTENDISSEAMTYIVAGSDTGAVTLTYLNWIVAKHPEVQKELCEELNTLQGDFTHKRLKECKCMNNVIDETMRLYGAAPGALPRCVPSDGLVVQGHHVPGGVTVSTHAWTLHRDPAIFPSPEEFIPSRWDNPTPEMKDAFMPFGGQSRACLGVHLARMELRLATALVYRAFPQGLKVAYGAPTAKTSGMSDGDMDALNFFLIMPKGHRCLMKAA